MQQWKIEFLYQSGEFHSAIQIATTDLDQAISLARHMLPRTADEFQITPGGIVFPETHKALTTH